MKIHEVWHWKEMREHFFAAFVDKFLKIKTEASGWPSWCTDDVKKQKFIDDVREKEGVELEPSKMVANSGRKAVSKLMLNSFWGKFGMRDTLTKTEFVYAPKRYYDLMRSKVNKIHDVHIISDDCVMVTHSPDEDYNEGNNSSNLPIAAMTTSYARLRLLKMLRQLDSRTLYFDTDSVIYTSKAEQWEPSLGNILGDWDNQLEKGESHIVSFASLGPKTYTYTTDTGRVEIKAKGISQNGFTENILGMDLQPTGTALASGTFSHLLENKADEVQVVYPFHLKKNSKDCSIHNVMMPKTIRLVYDKRILHDDYTTRAYGTKLYIKNYLPTFGKYFVQFGKVTPVLSLCQFEFLV